MHSENYYRTICENSIEGIYQTTTNGRFIFANQSLATIYGYSSPEELLHIITNIAEQIYVDINRRKQFQQEIEKNGYVKNFISQIYKNDKTKIWILENARAVYDDNGDILYYEGFVTDITLLKMEEKKKQQIQKKVFQKEKEQALITLERGLGHDLNNILSPILGYSEMLMDVFTHDAKVEKFISSIYKSSRRARDLVQHIHYLGKTVPMKQKHFQISDVVDQVIKLISVNLPKTIQINTVIDPQVKQFVGDSLCFQQILLNLSENGIQAMESTGGLLEINISQEYITSEKIKQNALMLDEGNYLLVKISDTGEGINPIFLDKIFDPYFSTKNLGIGHGLGLATVKNIVHSCYGDISVSSQPGQGSEFYVYLPQAQTVIKKDISQSESHKDQQIRKHIMLVDDDDDVLHIQQQLIEHLGYRVTVFSDSQLALQSFSQNPNDYDLVVTDMNMPKMSGLVLSKQLLHINAHIPIILCTGFSESINEATAKSAGIKKYILKPLTTMKLSHDLESVLKEKEDLYM